MSKYQEALDDLWYGCPDPKSQIKSKEVLQELVVKETPMKAKILGHDEDWLTGLKIAYGECPKCKFHVCDDEFYCRNCGQRVYFEESEE